MSTPLAAIALPTTVATVLTETSPPEEAPAPVAQLAGPRPAEPLSDRVTASGDGANPRSRPSRSVSVIGSVRDGTLLTNLDE